MRKVYDIQLGHYVPVFEADDVNPENGQPDAGQDTAPSGNDENKSVEQNPEISRVNAELGAENKKYTQQKQQIVNMYNANKQAASDALASARDAASRQDVQTAYDKVQTNRDVLAARKKILDLDMKYAEDINRIELDHAKKVNAIENARLQILQKMNNEKFATLPSKYSFLNESNVGQAKIYMNTLISEDDDSPIRGMVDFKRAFQDTDIVYGKDRNGFYMLCIDRDDFNKIMAALQGAGYMKDELLGTLMPQILNRTAMISAES